jgi:hypothetical protein
MDWIKYVPKEAGLTRRTRYHSVTTKLCCEEVLQVSHLNVTARSPTSLYSLLLQLQRSLGLGLVSKIPSARFLAEPKHELHSLKCTNVIHVEILPFWYFLEASFPSGRCEDQQLLQQRSMMRHTSLKGRDNLVEGLDVAHTWH